MFKFKDVEKRFGKDIADRIINKGKILKQADYDNGNNSVTFNQPIIEGGQGKNELYDKTIPSFLKKYGKKWNAKVYDETITAQENTFNQMEDGSKVYTGPKIPVTIIEVTPEMKKSVQGTRNLYLRYSVQLVYQVGWLMKYRIVWKTILFHKRQKICIKQVSSNICFLKIIGI